MKATRRTTYMLYTRRQVISRRQGIWQWVRFLFIGMTKSKEVSSFRNRDSLLTLPCKVHVAARENPIVNRLNKTKVEREVDHEAEKADRLREEASKRREETAAKVRRYPPHKLHYNTHLTNVPQRKAELELAQKREAEKKARSYDHAWESTEPSTSGGGDREDDDFWGENAMVEVDEARMKEFEDFI
jgi:hypothetical protein